MSFLLPFMTPVANWRCCCLQFVGIIGRSEADLGSSPLHIFCDGGSWRHTITICHHAVCKAAPKPCGLLDDSRCWWEIARQVTRITSATRKLWPTRLKVCWKASKWCQSQGLVPRSSWRCNEGNWHIGMEHLADHQRWNVGSLHWVDPPGAKFNCPATVVKLKLVEHSRADVEDRISIHSSGWPNQLGEHWRHTLCEIPVKTSWLGGSPPDVEGEVHLHVGIFCLLLCKHLFTYCQEQ